MNMRFSKLLAPLAALAALGFSGSASAYAIGTCMVPGVVPPGCVAGQKTEGWDGPGRGSASLGYYIGNPNRADKGYGGLAEATIENAFLAAAATWSSVVQVSFSKVGDADLGATGFNNNRSVTLYFHGSSSDTQSSVAGHAFDGQWNVQTGAGSVFAHSWGPDDIMSESSAGNMHFDMDEDWVTSGAPNIVFPFPAGTLHVAIDLETVMLHELGHVLGLDHVAGNSLSDPVMQTFYWGEHRTLAQDDINGALSLYCGTNEVCGNNPAPEPSSVLLLGAALLAMRLSRRRAT